MTAAKQFHMAILTYPLSAAAEIEADVMFSQHKLFYVEKKNLMSIVTWTENSGI